jgi:hypothetical protein
MANIKTSKHSKTEFTEGESLQNYCCKPQTATIIGKPTVGEADREAAAWTRWWWRWSEKHRCGPDSGGGSVASRRVLRRSRHVMEEEREAQ